MNEDKNIGPLSGLPPTEVQGPRRKAPGYYIGETVGGRLRPKGTRGAQHDQMKFGGNRVNYPDVERYPNGAIAGKRNKAARRIIRKAFMKAGSRVEKNIRLSRAMKAQAREIVHDDHEDKSRTAQSRRARRLYEAELALHQTVYVPDSKELRKMRTARRKQKREGRKDAIAKLVDALNGE